MMKLWIARVVVNVSCALVQVIGGRIDWERDHVNINGSATCRSVSGLDCDLSCGSISVVVSGAVRSAARLVVV